MFLNHNDGSSDLISIGNYVYNPKFTIGQGSFGKVYIAENQKNGNKVAIKKLDLKFFEMNPYFTEQLNNEIAVMQKLNHQNIVKLIDLLKSSSSFYFVTEYCKDGDLKDVFQKNRMSEEEAKSLIFQVISGYQQLFKYQIIHRDMKPANILKHDKTYKLCDFGFAKFVDSNYNQICESYVGSPLYMSPQILNKENYTAKCDVWSLGVIAYEALFGTTPWTGTDEKNLLNNIKSKKINFQQLKIQPYLQVFLQKTLEFQEDKRYFLKQNVF